MVLVGECIGVSLVHSAAGLDNPYNEEQENLNRFIKVSSSNLHVLQPMPYILHILTVETLIHI